MRQQEGTIVKKEEIIYVDNRGWKYQVMPGLRSRHLQGEIPEARKPEMDLLSPPPLEGHTGGSGGGPQAYGQEKEMGPLLPGEWGGAEPHH